MICNKKHQLLIFFLSFSFITIVTGQTKLTFYFDGYYHPVPDKVGSSFTGSGSATDGFFFVQAFNNKTGRLAFEAHLSDSVTQALQGPFISYHDDGTIDEEGNYINGKQEGLWLMRDANKVIIDSVIYENDLVKNATWITYRSDGSKKSASFMPNADTTFITYFDIGGNISRKDTVVESQIFTKTEHEPTFEGGDEMWKAYINNVIQNNSKKLLDVDKGIYVMRVVINYDGSVSGVRGEGIQNFTLTQVVTEALKKGPKWKPAIQNKRAVNAYKFLKVEVKSTGAIQ